MSVSTSYGFVESTEVIMLIELSCTSEN